MQPLMFLNQTTGARRGLAESARLAWDATVRSGNRDRWHRKGVRTRDCHLPIRLEAAATEEPAGAGIETTTPDGHGFLWTGDEFTHPVRNCANPGKEQFGESRPQRLLAYRARGRGSTSRHLSERPVNPVSNPRYSCDNCKT